MLGTRCDVEKLAGSMYRATVLRVKETNGTANYREISLLRISGRLFGRVLIEKSYSENLSTK